MRSIHEVDVCKIYGGSLGTFTTKNLKLMFLTQDIQKIVASLKKKVIDFALKSTTTTTREGLLKLHL